MEVSIQIKKMKIRQLTRSNKAGAPYQRLPEVEDQIRSGLGMDGADLCKRAKISKIEDKEFLQEEAIVYLVREYQDRGDFKGTGELLSVMIERIKSFVDKRVRYPLAPQNVDECFQEVIHEVVIAILDLKTDKNDFAEVRFWRWLDRKTLVALRKHIKRQRIGARTESIDKQVAEHSDTSFVEVPDALRDGGIGSDDAAFILECLAQFDNNERTAYLLRHHAGLQIDSKNPHELTLSRYFGVSAKTIYNWLNEAQKKIDKLQRGKGNER